MGQSSLLKPPATDAATSARMRRVRTKGTTPEIALRSVLRASRTRYKSNYGLLPGSPDFVLPEHRAVVFVHGCFWHGCPCRSLPKRNRAWWRNKIQANRRRDGRDQRRLRRAGWRVMVVWEHDDISRMTKRLSSFLGGACDSADHRYSGKSEPKPTRRKVSG